MQDADRLREQVEEMTVRAEARAAVSEDYQKIVIERRSIVEREVHKLRHMIEVFSMGEQLLRQRQKTLLEPKTPDISPTEIALGGIEDAILNMGTLSQQASRAISHNEGALAALSALEQMFQQKAQEAISRARGMAVQGARATGVAERREESRAAQRLTETPFVTSSQGVGAVSGFLDNTKLTHTT